MHNLLVKKQTSVEQDAADATTDVTACKDPFINDVEISKLLRYLITLGLRRPGLFLKRVAVYDLPLYVGAELTLVSSTQAGH